MSDQLALPCRLYRGGTSRGLFISEKDFAYPREVRERKAIVALDPADRAQALYRLARAQHGAGDLTGARRSVMGALEIAPNYEDALELLLLIREGRS